MAMVKGYSNSSKESRNALTSLWNVLFDPCQEWMSFEPSLGLYVYPCYACRHMFSSLNSLQDHVNRRIIVLKYNCPGCPNEVLTFYNRCSFLLHARSHHNLEEGQINLREVDIFPLPVQLAGFLPHTSIPSLYAEDEESVTDISLNTKFYSADIKQKGQPTIVLTPNDLVWRQNSTPLALKQICKNVPKCELISVERQNIQSLQDSHEQDNVDNDVEYPLYIKRETNGYNNEVTIPVISKIESLQEKQFKSPHCLECNTYQFDTMAGHYQGGNKPNDVNLSCLVCKFVAPTNCSLLAHIRIHSNTPPHVCPDCGKDFGAPEPLMQHVNSECFHLAKNVRFKCPGKKCNKLFATSTTFTNHFKLHLNCIVTCSLCSTTFSTMEKAYDHAKTHEEICNFSKIYNCSVCTNLGALNESSYTKHLEEHINDTEKCVYVYMCKTCRSYFRSSITYASHLLKCLDKSESSIKKRSILQKSNSRHCDEIHNKICTTENPLGTPNELKEGNEMKSQISSTKKYFCLLCNKQIKPEEKRIHSRVCMYAQPIVIIENLGAKLLSTYELIERPSQSGYSSRVDENNKRKRKRFQLNKCNKHRKVDRVETELIAEEPILFDGIYNCKLCVYVNEDRSTFHSHIKSHRDISTAYQCMECGECFVVKPSLIKHLMHFHNISDDQSYLKENDCYIEKSLEETETSRSSAWNSVKENQCKICLQEFDDALLLNNHFRIHGMAYLMKNK